METKQKNNKKYTNKPLVVLVAIFTIAVVTMFILTHRKTEKNGVGGSTTSIQTVAEEEVPKTMIDLEKTENVEIVDGEKENNSQELAKEKTFQGMNIKEIELKTNDGVTEFKALVENNSGTDYAGGDITIVFTNEDGSEYARLKSSLPAIQNGKINQIDAGTTADVANAYNFRIE